MIEHLRALAHHCERAIAGLRRHPAAAAAVIGTVAVAFFLVGLVHALGNVVAASTGSWQQAQMVVYLEPDATPEEVDDIRRTVASWPAVTRADHVSSERAMAEFLAASDADDALIDGIESSMLPASIEVTLAAGVRRIAELQPVVESMRSAPGIEDIEFADPWVAKLGRTERALESASGLALLLAILACLYLASMAIGARFGPRVEEAAVARLFGASNAFVRVPLLLEGAAQGAMGAALAVLGVWGFSSALGPDIGAIFGPDTSVAAALPGGSEIAAFIAIGAGVGLLSTWLATRRHARA